MRWSWRIPHNTISIIVKDTCKAICDLLAPEYMRTPNSEQECRSVAERFYRKWNFPGCLGAIDGKHVSIKKPNQSGSLYFNYKKFFSIVLMAIADADCKFLYVSVGVNGRASDGGIFENYEFNRSLNDNSLNLPNQRSNEPPFTFIADSAFPLRKNIMKPYPSRNITVQQKIFNYRLSRARRCVENSFGILSNRFRCLSTTLQVQPISAKYIVTACCILHNMLIVKIPNYLPTSVAVLGQQIESDRRFGRFRTTIERRTASEEAIETRDRLAMFFVNEGSVNFQYSNLSIVERRELELMDVDQ